jgi:hypothetical protein
MNPSLLNVRHALLQKLRVKIYDLVVQKLPFVQRGNISHSQANVIRFVWRVGEENSVLHIVLPGTLVSSCASTRCRRRIIVGQIHFPNNPSSPGHFLFSAKNVFCDCRKEASESAKLHIYHGERGHCCLYVCTGFHGICGPLEISTSGDGQLAEPRSWRWRMKTGIPCGP